MRDLAFAHYVKALLASGGRHAEAYALAKEKYPHTHPVMRFLEKSAIGTWDLNADPDFRAAGRAFIEMVKVQSLLGKINAISPFRDVPLNTRVLAQTERPVAYWTGQGNRKIASHAAFEQKLLGSLKITGLLALTNELLQGQGAVFESAVSNDLVNPIAHLEGVTFLDPGNVGFPDQSPASVTNGVAPVPSAGTDAASVSEDIRALFAAFGGSLETAVLAMHPETALSLALMQSPLGQTSLTVRGGELFGVPVVTSDSVPKDSDGAIVALVDPAGIMLSDNGVNITSSSIATIETAGDSDGPQYLSFWQQNLTGALAERFLNWEVARAGSVAWLSGVRWGE